jgi:hypothetical protein
VLIKARQASDALGATKMDRPEWIASTSDGWVYCTLTNNSSRGSRAARRRRRESARQQHDGPHHPLEGGRRLRRRDVRWNHFVLAGDPANERADAKGNVKGDCFGCPDGSVVDGAACSGSRPTWPTRDGQGRPRALGNNAMLAADPRSGEIRRFLSARRLRDHRRDRTPDGRTMFVNIQHPGETPSERSDPAEPRRFSNWPDFRPGGRPAQRDRGDQEARRRRDRHLRPDPVDGGKRRRTMQRARRQCIAARRRCTVANTLACSARLASPARSASAPAGGARRRRAARRRGRVPERRRRRGGARGDERAARGVSAAHRLQRAGRRIRPLPTVRASAAAAPRSRRRQAGPLADAEGRAREYAMRRDLSPAAIERRQVSVARRRQRGSTGGCPLPKRAAASLAAR